MTPAPTGTAAGISGWLRTYIYQARRAGGLTIDQKARLDRLDACSSEAVAVGDDDPRVRTLALSCPGAHWEPGPKQRAVVDSAGHAAARGPYGEQNAELSREKLNGNALLNALAHAAVLDLQAAIARELSRLRKGPEAAPTQTAMLEAAIARAEVAEKALAEANQSIMGLREGHLREKARRRAAEAAVNGDVPVVEENGAPEPVKPAERHRAQWRDEHGKSREKAFSTREEADEHAQAMKAQVAAVKANQAAAMTG